jgi:hypothetical protein
MAHPHCDNDPCVYDLPTLWAQTADKLMFTSLHFHIQEVRLHHPASTVLVRSLSLSYQHLHICVLHLERLNVAYFCHLQSEGSGRFADMTIIVTEVMQLSHSTGHLDAVRIGQDLWAFHIAYGTWDTANFCWTIYLLFVGMKTVRWTRKVAYSREWQWGVQSNG